MPMMQVQVGRGLVFSVLVLKVWESLGFRVWDLGFRVEGLGFRIQGLGFRIRGFGVQDPRFGSIQVSAFCLRLPFVIPPYSLAEQDFWDLIGLGFYRV